MVLPGLGGPAQHFLHRVLGWAKPPQTFSFLSQELNAFQKLLTPPARLQTPKGATSRSWPLNAQTKLWREREKDADCWGRQRLLLDDQLHIRVVTKQALGRGPAPQGYAHLHHTRQASSRAPSHPATTTFHKSMKEQQPRPTPPFPCGIQTLSELHWQINLRNRARPHPYSHSTDNHNILRLQK